MKTLTPALLIVFLTGCMDCKRNEQKMADAHAVIIATELEMITPVYMELYDAIKSQDERDRYRAMALVHQLVRGYEAKREVLESDTYTYEYPKDSIEGEVRTWLERTAAELETLNRATSPDNGDPSGSSSSRPRRVVLPP